MPNYAWYYLDRSSDTCYWCYSNEMSVTDFAAAVSAKNWKTNFCGRHGSIPNSV